MRKIAIALFALLLLLLGTMTSAAKTSEELADLARYFPANSPAYAGMRIDSAFIDELGDLLLLLDGKLDGAFGGMTVRDILDQAAQTIDEDADFATTFSWLGETAAVGITDPNFHELEVGEDDQAIVIALSVSDADAAELFLDNLTPAGYEKSETEGGYLYAPEEGGEDTPTIFLGSDVLLIRPSSLEAETLVPSFDETLADNADFQAAMERLPLEDYNAVAYVDPVILAAEIQEAMDENPNTLPMMISPVDALEAIGPQSAGFLLLDGRNLVMDVAVHIANPEAFAVTGFRFIDSPALDLSFANQLPATTALFLQDTGLGEQIITGLGQMESLGDFYDEAWEAGNLPYEQEGLRQLDETAVFLGQAFEGLSSLTLQEAFGWMTGNHIAFLNITEGISEELPVLVDFGVLVEATDSAAAENLLNAAPVVLEQLGLDYVDENGLLVVPVLGDMAQTDALDLIIGANGDLFAIGTRPTTSAVLNGEGGLADTEAFQYASQYFLADTQMLAYANFAALSEVLAVLAEAGDDDARDALMVLSLFDSGSITAVTDETGSGTARFVLTLGE